jgi:hypothetical protein
MTERLRWGVLITANIARLPSLTIFRRLTVDPSMPQASRTTALALVRVYAYFSNLGADAHVI